MTKTQSQRAFPVSWVIIALTWAAIFGILWQDHRREAVTYEAALSRAQADDEAAARREARLRPSFRVYTEQTFTRQANR